MKDDPIMVSIVCNTYNHEKYIADALESFVNQKTAFPFEVLVHDDASTDNTAMIIQDYERRFPHLIKPIIQEENQHSKNIKISMTYQFPRAKGKYIALCEGDDYWIDNYKLQKQVDYMEQHIDCSFCFTNGLTETQDGIIDHVIPWVKDCKRRKDQVEFNTGEIELLGYIPTASFVFRKSNNFHIISDNSFAGDCYIKLSMTEYGYAHFIDEKCVVYRRSNTTSATRVWESDPSTLIRISTRYINLFSDMKEITNHKYDDVFEYRIVQWEIKKYLSMRDCDALHNILTDKKIRALKYSRAFQTKAIVTCMFPKLVIGMRDMMKKATR